MFRVGCSSLHLPADVLNAGRVLSQVRTSLSQRPPVQGHQIISRSFGNWPGLWKPDLKQPHFDMTVKTPDNPHLKTSIEKVSDLEASHQTELLMMKYAAGELTHTDIKVKNVLPNPPLKEK